MPDRGTYIEVDGRPAVRFRRVYPHPLARVWTAVSEPAELRHWFPSAVVLSPDDPGRVEFRDDPHAPPSVGRVLVHEPPRRLAVSWGDDELHVELEPVAEGTRLTLVNVLGRPDAAARNAAGWSVCLAELDKLLRGVPGTGPHGDGAEPWRDHYDAYLAAGLPCGAPVPAAPDPVPGG